MVANTDSIQQKAMAESILHIDEARHCLEIYQRELKQETQGHIALDSKIVGAEDSLARTSRKLNNTTRQVTDMQTDLHNLQNVIKALNKDVQAAMRRAIRKARHNLKRSIKTKEDADKEFQRQQEKLDAYKDH